LEWFLKKKKLRVEKHKKKKNIARSFLQATNKTNAGINNRLAKLVDWLIVLLGNIAFDAFTNTSRKWIIRRCNIIEFLAGLLDSTSTGFFS